MRDGESTSKFIEELLGCDCSVDEAIEIEQYLFSKLSKYRNALERIAVGETDCCAARRSQHCVAVAREALNADAK